MAKVFVVSMLVALSHAAPGNYGAAPLVPAVVPGSVAVYSAYETVQAGPPVASTTHEVVGHKTVQVGTKAIQVGHRFVNAGSTVHQAAPYTYVAGQPKTKQNTVPLPAPAIPAAPAPYAAIPPAPVNLGPAPADTITQTKVAAPVRTHTHITPQVKRIEPELQVNKYTVEVPVAVPVPVEREVIVDKHVVKPYTVEVPQPYAVPSPYKVHPVKHVVETPVIKQYSYSVPQTVVTGAYAAHPAHVAHSAKPEGHHY